MPPRSMSTLVMRMHSLSLKPQLQITTRDRLQKITKRALACMLLAACLLACLSLLGKGERVTLDC